MNRRTDRQRKRGSLTVEASLVVPMCVMILALLLSLTFCGQEKAEKKWETRRRESGFSGQNVTGGVTGSGKEVQVKVSGKVSVWGRKNLIFETGIRQKIIRPVTFVRKVTAFRS